MRNAEVPMTFRDTLDDAMRDWCWVPSLMVTLAFWPRGQGYTAFEVKRCRQKGLLAFNVTLITPVQEQ